MTSDSGTGSPQPADASAEIDFDTLQEARARLQAICQLHAQSVVVFQHPERAWFRLTADEPVAEDPAEVRHLSTTASCLESVNDDPHVDHDVVERLAGEFGGAALSADADRWASEGAARVYCRVRTLPAILRFAPQNVLVDHEQTIGSLLAFVWDRLDTRDPIRQGISEAPDREPEEGEPADEAPWKGYPANSFHTFWALHALEAYQHRELALLPEAVLDKRPIAELWSARTLGVHAALIRGGGQRGDANQLAWALTAEFIHPPEPPLTVLSERYEVYRAALASFFAAQLPSGNWPLGEPIFHYPEAGNAYCYAFETLAELLRPALLPDAGRVVRDLLRPHLRALLRAMRYAEATAIELDAERLAWCSGHHPHRTAPEAWATAAVFSFLQNLRRLVGQWTSDAAAIDLGVRRPRFASPTAALQKLRERGDTWSKHGEVTVGRKLASLFVYPLLACEVSHTTIDPDRQLSSAPQAGAEPREQARSAILFGPPGTSKTTLVEALAGAVGWRFVSIHASDFLQLGMDQIPRRADEIFRRLMELDHTVVLFDEIDELIRERGERSDPVGRFLTTSMLPKLANLWEQRRVLFFVATNDISHADPAIRRSQRFDASIYVPPPGFLVKHALLRHELGAEPPAELTWDAVTSALDSLNFDGAHALGVFALLRYDQIAELAGRAQREAADGELNAGALRRALETMGEDLRKLEWHSDGEQLETPYKLHKHYVDSERQDFRAASVIRLGDGVPEHAVEVVATLPDGTRWARVTGFLEQHRTSVDEDGRWRITGDAVSAVDDGLLHYVVVPGDEGATEGG